MAANAEVVRGEVEEFRAIVPLVQVSKSIAVSSIQSATDASRHRVPPQPTSDAACEA